MSWTLSDVQRLREHTEMQGRFFSIEREVKARRILGDEVYDFIRDGRIEP